MISNRFLDETGLIYFWNKIKTYFSSIIPTKVSDLTNDAGYLTLSTLPVYDGGVQ